VESIPSLLRRPPWQGLVRLDQLRSGGSAALAA
jgi:hypothetical protein